MSPLAATATPLAATESYGSAGWAWLALTVVAVIALYLLVCFVSPFTRCKCMRGLLAKLF